MVQQPQHRLGHMIIHKLAQFFPKVLEPCSTKLETLFLFVYCYINSFTLTILLVKEIHRGHKLPLNDAKGQMTQRVNYCMKTLAVDTKVTF